MRLDLAENPGECAEQLRGWLAHTLFFGGSDFPKGLVGADGSPQSVHTEDRRILQEVECGHSRGAARQNGIT